jgi:hypothetical protein
MRLAGADFEVSAGVGVEPWLVRGVWYSLPPDVEAAGVGALDESRLLALALVRRP